MTHPGHGRDAVDIDALVADRYLEALLAATERRADDAPADAALDPELRDAARLLRSTFVRVHPSFRFEERLAGRLATLAAERSTHARASHGELVPFPSAGALAALDPHLAAVLDGRLDPAADPLEGRPRRRPVLVGGAVASAALSVLGVALVAWRAARPGPGPMVRAARIAHGRRLAAAAELASGALNPGRPA